MKILVQWTRANPRGWEEYDSAQWRALAKRPDPTGMGPGGTDDQPGWVFGLNVQGVHFTADHYAVEPLPGRGCRVITWNDDPTYYPEGGLRNGQIRTFLPLAPDPRFGGRWNTRQTVHFYGDATYRQRLLDAKMDPALVHTYEDLLAQLPESDIIRHGKLVSDELNAAHDARRASRGWREWTEGVPDSDLDERGRVSGMARGRVA